MPPRQLESKRFLESFLFGFAIDTLSGHRARFEPGDGNLLPAGFTDAKGAVFDPLQSLFDLLYELVFPVPDAQHEIAVGFQRGPIGGVWKIFFLLRHSGYGVVSLTQQLLETVIQKFFKVLEIFLFHRHLTLRANFG
jgi:hypothetical protein